MAVIMDIGLANDLYKRGSALDYGDSEVPDDCLTVLEQLVGPRLRNALEQDATRAPLLDCLSALFG